MLQLWLMRSYFSGVYLKAISFRKSSQTYCGISVWPITISWMGLPNGVVLGASAHTPAPKQYSFPNTTIEVWQMASTCCPIIIILMPLAIPIVMSQTYSETVLVMSFKNFLKQQKPQQLIYCLSDRSYRMSKPGQSKNVQQAKKRNNQIINNLKQTLGKPTIVQAQRTLKILEKLIDRIAIFLNLDSDFVVKFNEINNPTKLKLNKALLQQLSPQVLDLLVKEAKMEVEFRAHATVEQQERDGEIVEEEKKQEYLRIKKDMEYNFRSLVRSLEKFPGDLEILKSLKSNSTPNVEGSSIYESLSNYKIIMQKMLATAAEEQDSHAQMIKELETKIQSLEKTKAKCESELLGLRQERAKHTEEKKEEIDKLKSQIREVKNYKEKEIEKISKENKQLHDGLVKDHKTREDKLKAEINTQKGKLQKLRDENLKLQNKSKTEKSTNQAQLIDLINTYDKQMFSLTNGKSQCQKELKRVSDELNNLKRHFSQIQEQRKREEAILEADRQRRQRWQLMQRRKGEAATRIKQAYRLFKLKSKKKKKKKK